ncbi:MAG: RteC domain-containing protein [Saprospiraceae bacterium]
MINKENYTQILKNHDHELSRVRTTKELDPELVQESIRISIRYLNELKKEFLSTRRLTDDIEINFFRFVKPKILSKIIYFSKLRNLLDQSKLTSIERNPKPFNKAIDKIKEFAHFNAHFIHYIDSKDKSLDPIYFMRYRDIHLEFDEAYCIELDQDFTTGFDILLSIYLANKELKSDIISIFQNKDQILRSESNLSSRLKWTGSKIDLVEIIYAFHCSAQVNSGNASLTEISETFQKAFNIELGDIYRIFSQIKLRTSDPIRSLIHLSTSLSNHINNELDN